MYLQIEDPSEAPVPPEEVRIKHVQLSPYPDGRRVRMSLALTPFQSPPDISVVAQDARDREVSSLNIVGATEAQIALTMHLRDPETEDPVLIGITVSYADTGIVDQHEASLRVRVEGDRG